MSVLDVVDPKSTALVVIDMQNDYCCPGGWVERSGTRLDPLRAVISPIREVLTAARQAGVFVVHTRMVYDDYTFEDTRHRIVPKMIVGRRTCVRGTWGAEFVEELKPLPGERVVDKCRYSAFFNTDLEVGLRSRGIQTLIVTGVVAQVCVESTIRDAFFRDFDVILLRDCTASYDDQLYGATLKNVEISYGAVMTSTEIVDWLRAGATTPEALSASRPA